MAVEKDGPPSGSPKADSGAGAAPPSPAAPSQDTQDAHWVKEVLAGRRDAFEALVKKYQGLVYSIALSYVRDAHRAEDLTQEVFVQAFTALSQLRHEDSFVPWLLQIARNRASRHAVRAARHPEVREAALETVPAETKRDERLADLFALVEKLPEPMRQTILLRYQQGLSCKEIAAREGAPIGTVTSRLSRALLHLREAAGRTL